MSYRVTEMLNRPANAAEGDALKIILFLFAYSLPALIYLMFGNLLQGSELWINTPSLHTFVLKIYPFSLALCALLSLLPLSILTARGSKIALTGEIIILLTGLFVFLRLV
jgi:hypothetical protein